MDREREREIVRLLENVKIMWKFRESALWIVLLRKQLIDYNTLLLLLPSNSIYVQICLRDEREKTPQSIDLKSRVVWSCKIQTC